MLVERDYNLPSRVAELERRIQKLELELEKISKEKTCGECSNDKTKDGQKI